RCSNDTTYSSANTTTDNITLLNRARPADFPSAPLKLDVPGDASPKTRHTLFLVFITLTQLVQSIPLGAGINAGLSIGASLASI
ncbi:hypothetical protein C8A00DRAFT_38393, partial [Chaetomidium leptoderma]